jgi:methionine-rich copper-binding protein CopC
MDQNVLVPHLAQRRATSLNLPMKKFALLLVALLMVPVHANAHSGVVATNPSTDQVVAVMPSEISVTFSEELLVLSDKEINTITVTAPDGSLLENLASRVKGPTLIATVPALDPALNYEYPSGLYTVNYRVVSADGHEVTDSYTFSLNAPMLLATESPADEGDKQDGGDGVLPLPILIAILILLTAGGILLIRLRKR